METVADPVNPPPRRAPTRLSEDLRRLLERAAGRAVTVREIIEILHGRGFDVLVMILALPFCAPIPLPGLSTPFGLILMFFGFRIGFRKHPWLPRRLLERRIPLSTLSKIVHGALAVAAPLERWLHPRFRFFKNWNAFAFLNGMAIASNGFVLALPLPIPLTNTFPAWSTLLLAAGMMEEDGAVIVAGYATAALTWLYLFLLIWLGKIGLGWFGF